MTDHLPEELVEALATTDEAELRVPEDERRGMDLDEPVPGLAIVEELSRDAPDARDASNALDPPAAGGAVAEAPGLSILERRPGSREPRPYRFPSFERERLANGLTVIHAHLPGRPLLSAQLVLDGGGSREPADEAGVTALMARAMPEGTERRDAIELIEASERLGAELHADAGWESASVSLEVPRSKVAAALELLVEMALAPTFPEAEVERLRGERLNDLLQVRADPRRRAERVFSQTIYAPSAPFSRPMAGDEETVRGLAREHVVARHRQHLDPAKATFVVAGDLHGLSVVELAERAFDGWEGPPSAPSADMAAVDDSPNPAGRRLVLVDRPGAAQTEIRVGHVGLRRVIPEFHAVAVLSSILGGLFNSRLQRLLREDRGYTYGIHAGFDLRRWAGPFAVRTAVQTEVTVPALQDIMGELRRIRETPAEPAELKEARDYLIGVFPLRFEAPPQVVAAIMGLVLFGLPDDELDRYRPAVAAVTADDVHRASRHVRPDDASTVLVGDARAFESELRGAGLGEVTLIAD